ncbi:RluA family pseudouridine synthase [Aneurinibacillus aneurinilyticus]|jgi:23S rRNA pseudouridine1911/1915/1917 synthase|uniref:Pseudouridine synthase n=2 Tax=Aneurinibacillus aneurinilyticus TaxID=1391 RepID=A0A848CL95_ANEAE|nr:RluA family pseudouridine synthase [Aneurinibacillus aneurinilyticus]ERI09975.1 pseudouridine synthase, RluA family [Aneurinibacillus aneurinilyticus ATCC 12856]MCI1692567.1 RluA family pseudouridine synthase [Aneurinibacillus aneurinilyticus]MED0670237.1 RluA family pseudouridine synthase [Aneurinibacillus aneurinilyticus]MED0705173.1 RluA family pseudouridine synthase [Aneurinibacillus aneurinilyticus]MED0725669.1 RluA family pseudouridine synthase [Aneurinibacillus aneurinilyticus]
MKKEQTGKNQVLRFIVPPDVQDAEKNVRSFLREDHGISRSLLVELKHVKGIRLNGAATYLDHSLQAGDVVELHLPEEESENIVPEPIPLQIVFEDEDILIVNKPSNLCVHPTLLHPDGTLANGVLYHWQLLGISRKFRAVNRLDKDTSGLVLIAKSQFSHQQLATVQRQNGITRYYEALVHGQVKEDEGTIDAPIMRKADSLMERVVHEDGQWARTHYKVLKRYNEFTHIRIKLDTGRTHQIRVHMSHIGHPLLGDDLYGGERTLISRQALHSRILSFPHPRHKELLTFTTPLPDDMYCLIKQ